MIPCRVTNPDLRVVLDAGMDRIVEPNQRTIKYSPKWGFRISGDHHLFQGVVSCSASTENGGVHQEQPYFIINEGKRSYDNIYIFIT